MKYAQYSGGFLLILTMCFNEGHTYKTYHIGNQKLYTTYQIPIHAYDLLYIAVCLNIYCIRMIRIVLMYVAAVSSIVHILIAKKCPYRFDNKFIKIVIISFNYQS